MNKTKLYVTYNMYQSTQNNQKLLFTIAPTLAIFPGKTFELDNQPNNVPSWDFHESDFIRY